jgi:hypothetical protein
MSKCSILGAVYSSSKELWEPSDVVTKAHVPCFITSLPRLRDPLAISVAQSLDISFTAYRQITVPIGTAVKARDRIKVEPIKADSATYEVVEVMSQDESPALLLVLHCRKLGAP